MPPNLLNRARSSSDGSQTPLGWEWTVPTTEKSAGSVWSWKIAWRFPLTVPGTRISSVIVPSSARRIAPNSRGYMSRDASRIIRSVFRAIAETGFMGTSSLSRQLVLDPAVEVVPEPDELRMPLGCREDDVLGAFQGRLVLPIHDQDAFLRLHQLDVDLPRRREHVRTRCGLERRNRGRDDRLDVRIHDRSARRHRVRGGSGRRRDDDAIRANSLYEFGAEAGLKVSNLRDLGGVDDGFVHAVENPLPVHRHPEPHPFLDPIVPARDPVQVAVRFLRVHLGEEPQGSGVDAEHFRVAKLERPQDRAVPADREDHVRFHVGQRHPFAVEHASEVRFEEDLMRGRQTSGDLFRGGHRARDVRIRGDAELHRIASPPRRSPTPARSVLALESKGKSRSRPARSSTSPPASRTINVPAAMSTTRSLRSGTALCM